MIQEDVHSDRHHCVDNGDGTFSYQTHNAGDFNTYATAEEAIEHIGYDGKTKVI